MATKEKYFSIVETIKFAFETVFQNFGFFFKLLLSIAGLFLAVLIVPGLIIASMYRNISSPAYIAGLIALTFFLFLLWWSFLGIGYYKIILNFYDNKPNALSTLFSQKKLFMKYFIANFIYFFIVCVGTVLFIIPGIIWGVMYGFYPYVMIEENTGILESFRRSAAIVSGYKWPLVGISLFFTSLLMLVSRAYLPALLFIIPTFSLSWVYMYRKLKNES